MQYTTEELQTILDLHKKWLYNSKEGKCANLRKADLRGANLRDANLRKAYLRDADLRDANLSGAYLSGAYLRGANLRDADMSGANLRDADLRDANLRKAYLRDAYLRFADMSGAYLRGANLRDADLRDANLRGADLRCAYLRFADMSGAYLRGANLRDADLRCANLRGADLRCADLRGADMSGAKNISQLTASLLSIVPEIGEFIGYKKAYAKVNDINVIVKLKIAEDAKRSNATGRKCRCSKANVLSITDPNGNTLNSACSSYDKNFIYNVGEMVEVSDFDDDRWEECAPGIHFFITRAEAENY